MNKRNIYIVLGLLFLGGAWVLFRPELLFVKTQVNEEFPGATSEVAATTDSALPLLSGSFHSVAHDTMGTADVHELPSGARVLRLTDFMTSNGPDVRVYLVAATGDVAAGNSSFTCVLTKSSSGRKRNQAPPMKRSPRTI